MTVPGKRGHMRTTGNAAFVKQTYGGTIMGVAGDSTIITKDLSLLDGLTDNQLGGYDALPRLRDSASTLLYNTKKALSSGTFAYNAAKARTFVITRIATSLSGVSKTNLLFMGIGSSRRPIMDFQHDFGAKLLTAWRANLFSWLGLLDNGNKIKSRRLWLSVERNLEGGAAPGSLSTTNMWDLADGNATNKAVDKASTPTRAIPGRLVMKVDFVTVTTSGGDFFSYKPITGM